MGTDSHESQTACLVEETRTLPYDSIGPARRKRREVRLFKKLPLSSSASKVLNFTHHGVVKRTGVRASHCNSVYLFDGGVDEEDNCDFPDFLAKLSDEQGLSKLIKIGLVRSRSFPPEGWQTSKYILQISKMGRPTLETGVRSRMTAVKDKISPVPDTLSAPCTPDILHDTPKAVGFSCSHSTEADSSVDLASIPDAMIIDKVFHDKDDDVRMCDGGPQAASNVTPKAVIDGLYSAGRTALVQNVEGSLRCPLPQTLLEVKDLSFRACPPSAKVLICGRRREMEDMAVIVPFFVQVPRNKMMDGQMIDLHFYGVYDGHGGSQASKYCAKRLHHALAEEIASCSMNGDKSHSGAWQSIMSSCFMKVDKEVGGVCPFGACDDVNSSADCCVGSIAPENTGTTAVVAVVSSSQIIIANCGDSRAVLSRGGKAIPLSQDHKPERADETRRIEAAGGRVIAWKGFRVGALLALSRAIGDRYLKRYVISEPDVTCFQRTEEDECLILASDGLWDVLDNETACDMARRCLAASRGSREYRVTSEGDDHASASAAATLVKLACGKGSQDNISVVVIDLSCRTK